MQRLWRKRRCSVAAMIALSACAGGPPPPRYTPTAFDALPSWDADNHAAALRPFQAWCGALEQLPPGKTVGQGPLAAPALVWQDICADAEVTSQRGARDFFEAHFTPFLVSADDKETGLFTG